ncbi:MAG TPA: metal ABC transporter permease [Mycobacteriales bacterium]|nr:metal ABC transporter permease [Mycobacteriales bacterium]
MFALLLGQHFVQTGLIAAAVVAVVAGAIGPFVISRNMSFAVHAFAELGFTGAAAALLLGLDPTYGVLGGSFLVAGLVGGLGLRGRERDSVIGTVLAFGLGIGVLLLTLYHHYANAAVHLLFGDILTVSPAELRLLVIMAVLALTGLALLYRPLLFASVDPDVAEARGAPLRLLSIAFLCLLALAVAAAVQAVGVLLILSLVITPAAAAQRLTHRPGAAIAVSIGLALVAADGGILLALLHPAWPPSFFITSVSFVCYLAARLAGGRLQARARDRLRARGSDGERRIDGARVEAPA